VTATAGDENDLLSTPGEGVIEALAAELNTMIHVRCRELARKQLGRPLYGTDEWAAEISAPNSDQRRTTVKHEYMTRLRILKAARADLQRAVLDARKHGLSWRDVGRACGITRQAAYDRWGAAEKQQERTREAADDWARKTQIDSGAG
jgi:hypothetical protein